MSTFVSILAKHDDSFVKNIQIKIMWDYGLLCRLQLITFCDKEIQGRTLKFRFFYPGWLPKITWSQLEIKSKNK